MGIGIPKEIAMKIFLIKGGNVSAYLPELEKYRKIIIHTNEFDLFLVVGYQRSFG